MVDAILCRAPRHVMYLCSPINFLEPLSADVPGVALCCRNLRYKAEWHCTPSVTMPKLNMKNVVFLRNDAHIFYRVTFRTYQIVRRFFNSRDRVPVRAGGGEHLRDTALTAKSPFIGVARRGYARSERVFSGYANITRLWKNIWR